VLVEVLERTSDLIILPPGPLPSPIEFKATPASLATFLASGEAFNLPASGVLRSGLVRERDDLAFGPEASTETSASVTAGEEGSEYVSNTLTSSALVTKMANGYK
jgi:hypothetical protein